MLLAGDAGLGAGMGLSMLWPSVCGLVMTPGVDEGVQDAQKVQAAGTGGG